MNAMDVALICKALGDANRLEIVKMLSDVRSAAVSCWNGLKLPSRPSLTT